MRHRKAKIILSRTPAERRALARKMAIAFFEHGKISTTAPRARFVRRFVEQLVTVAKPATLAVRRQVIATLGNRAAAARVLDRAKQYRSRPGGYTRVTKLPRRRRGDGTPLVQLEWI